MNNKRIFGWSNRNCNTFETWPWQQ